MSFCWAVELIVVICIRGFASAESWRRWLSLCVAYMVKFTATGCQNLSYPDNDISDMFHLSSSPCHGIPRDMHASLVSCLWHATLLKIRWTQCRTALFRNAGACLTLGAYLSVRMAVSLPKLLKNFLYYLTALSPSITTTKRLATWCRSA